MLNYTIEMYIWNQTGNYKSIISANTQHTSMATPTFGMYISYKGFLITYIEAMMYGMYTKMEYMC